MNDERMPMTLPNADIYLGPRPGGRPDNISPMPTPEKPLADAAEHALKDHTHQKGQARITCPWCGQVQEGGEEFKAHINAQHSRQLGESVEDARDQELVAQIKGRQKREQQEAQQEKEKSASTPDDALLGEDALG